ncbi:hypothetical protein Lal_00049767 [Lupinus albus]|uniref:Putative immunoglobulin-like protein n=1 Tax=Lupinus albus TaxID=3870 RepID=A0A6A5M485_LUPAL|nr:putative immunoglobulin-like protein [Lupinus albus]KAF1867338.1 hypothetical protein Lal_00049767 [Lupinus albus]
MNRRETNPHFSRPRNQHEDQQQPPIPTVQHQEHDGQPPSLFPLEGPPTIQPEDQPYHPHFPLQPRRHADNQQLPISQASSREKRGRTPREGARKQHEDQPYLPPRAYGGQPLPREKRDRTPHGGARTQHEDQPQPLPQEHLGQPPHEGSREQHEDQPYLIPRAYGGWPPRKARTQHEDQPHQPPQDHRGQPSQVNFQEQSPKHHGSSMLPPLERHHGHRKKPDHGRRPLGIGVDSSQKSKACTWCGIVFCLIFWFVLIIVGLIVLIVYLVFRPQSPHFDVSSVTLNAAYLDLGYVLNADVTLLANFTNPNKRVHVDFSSVIIYLYYGSALIATQYVEPFSAARNQSRFAAIHMVSSQVQLPLGESQRMAKQMESNGVLLEVSGVFRAQSKLGKILRYSYNLYGHCNIMVTRPPVGVLLKKKCRTKR